MNGRYNLGNLGIEKVTLYDASVSGDFTGTGTTKDLYDDVRNYDYILITTWTYSENNHNGKTMLIPTCLINTTDGENAWIIYMGGNSSRYIGFNFTNGYDKLMIYGQQSYASSTFMKVIKVIGIR